MEQLSDRFLTTCSPQSSYVSADARRAAFPTSVPYPVPTRPLDNRPPFSLGPESDGFFALPDGMRLWWRSISPVRAPAGVMCFFHGYGDHSSFAMIQLAREYVSELGFVALLVDMPNHGRSDGVHVLVRDWAALLDAMELWCDAVCEPARVAQPGKPKLPFFGYGQSMGGAVLIDLAMRKPDRFAGLVLLAPMVKIAPEVRPHPLVESALRHVVCRIPLLRDMALVPNDGFFEAIFAPEAGWRLREHAQNVLNYKGPTRLRTGLTLIDAADGIAARLEALVTPFLVLHGAADVTTSPELSEELHRRAGAADKTLVLVEGARHGLDFGETPAVHERVFGATFNWIRKRLAPA